MKPRCLADFGIALLVSGVLPTPLIAQRTQTVQAPGPYTRIAIMRALDGHPVGWEAGYIRHLEWRRQAKDSFGWYSYSVWTSSERQRWIVYATLDHTVAELNNPVAPAEDERDILIKVLPHAQFLVNWLYEFLPALSLGNGVPTPTLQAKYTAMELNQGAGKAFQGALAAEPSALQGETLWCRLVVGGNTPRYVRLRPRVSPVAILDEHADQALLDKVNGLISSMAVETPKASAKHGWLTSRPSRPLRGTTSAARSVPRFARTKRPSMRQPPGAAPKDGAWWRRRSL
jgi:hypothetical protein